MSLKLSFQYLSQSNIFRQLQLSFCLVIIKYSINMHETKREKKRGRKKRSLIQSSKQFPIPLPRQRAKERCLKMINHRIRKGEGEGGDTGRCSCLIIQAVCLKLEDGFESLNYREQEDPERASKAGNEDHNYNNKSVKVMLCVNCCRSWGQKRKKLTSYLIWSQQGQAFSKN